MAPLSQSDMIALGTSIPFGILSIVLAVVGILYSRRKSEDSAADSTREEGEGRVSIAQYGQNSSAAARDQVYNYNSNNTGSPENKTGGNGSTHE